VDHAEHALAALHQLGQGLQAWRAVGRRRVVFDRTMGVALAASALSMLR
jgi:hypothetical protein